MGTQKLAAGLKLPLIHPAIDSVSPCVDVDRARFTSWYEMFPRSCTSNPARHGTLRDCIERLDYVANMGFDVLCLPQVLGDG